MSINDPEMSLWNSSLFNMPDWMITIMIVMDCPHFANCFAPSLQKSKLLQSVLKATEKALIVFAKPIVAVFIQQKHKRLDSHHQVRHITFNTNKMT